LSDLNRSKIGFDEWEFSIERKQRYGLSLTGTEKQRQLVLLALIWGKCPFCPSIFEVSYQKGLTFTLAEDTQNIPIIKEVNDFVCLFDMKKVFNKVIFIEDYLGGRFTDEADYIWRWFLCIASRIRKPPNRNINQELRNFRKMQEWKAAEKQP
jgi:hypothetical protein